MLPSKFCVMWSILCVLYSAYQSLTADVPGCNRNIMRRHFGDTLTFVCSVNTTDFNSYRWTHCSNTLIAEQRRVPTSSRIKLEDNYSLVIEQAMVSDEGRYRCKYKEDIIAEYCLEIIVAPVKFYIKVDDREISQSGRLVLGADGTINATCHVEGARPVNNLTWIDNNLIIHDSSEYSMDTQINDTFDSFSEISFQQKTLFGTLSCLRHGLDRQGSQNITLQFSSKEVFRSTTPLKETTSRAGDNSVITIIISSSVSILIAITIVVTIYVKSTLRNRMTTPSCSVISSTNESTGLDMQLSYVTDGATDDVKGTENNINRDDVIMQSQLPGNGFMKYWLAICHSSGVLGNVKLVAKSVSDTAQVVDLMKFRTLATRLLTLPKHENIVDVFGISIDDVPYYIYLEYVEYGTLRNYMLRNYLKRRNTQIDPITEQRNVGPEVEKLSLTRFSVNVTDGMTFLFENDFRHPVLTSSKVLIASSGKCKLYDFVPAELAESRLMRIIEKKNAPLAWLPPETIFLRQYSEKSDVWSLAVTLWEIFSLGETPYSGMTEEEIEKQIRKENYLSQPMSCPGAIFGMILSCWDKTPSTRPSFQYLHEHLRGVLTSLEQSSASSTKCTEEEEVSYFTLEETLNDNSYI